ncbi:MAG: preprotein translocase subunit SecG [Dehalococcoidia bacterium]|jgi:preprotein translocase subunit SecG|nr:preprotein translocase subunit SecG [Dehalococcoidia bacterium]MCC7088788.1 preprotein translocase subunit SecG [Dehalococcoidia bacterium]MCO5200807.1 preprotein translocase subunit SecG [Chloroflexota bacterium]NJD65889.1 preprotein translocase subunit SecG [Chloroflexota bacterium]PWB44939.1 MAG: preprotein translocase subunit SecG [Dehalococcoidia bacterium]
MFMNVLQIIVSVTLIVVVLLQAKGSGFGAALGGMSGGSVYRTKRGLEKTLFQATILLIIVFIFVSFLSVQSQK